MLRVNYEVIEVRDWLVLDLRLDRFFGFRFSLWFSQLGCNDSPNPAETFPTQSHPPCAIQHIKLYMEV